MHTRYPAAEHLALSLTIADDDTVDELAGRWRAEYLTRTGGEPSESMIALARDLLTQRVEGKAPPLPPSSSSASWRLLPELVVGVPRD